MKDRLKGLLVWTSGTALLAAVLVDTLAMIGRQVRVPLLGSIEIVEALVLIASAGALIIATLQNVHARVNLLFDRMPPNWRSKSRTLHAIATALFAAALLIGSLWVTADLWNGHEESELLHIPYRPLRIIVVLALAALVAIALRDIMRRDIER